jgi:hypothetical protein
LLSEQADFAFPSECFLIILYACDWKPFALMLNTKKMFVIYSNMNNGPHPTLLNYNKPHGRAENSAHLLYTCLSKENFGAVLVFFQYMRFKGLLNRINSMGPTF